MRRGIPPSVDRTLQRRQRLISGVFLALVIPGVAIFFALRLLDAREDFTPMPFQQRDSPEATREQAELASANQAVQRAVIARFGRQYLNKVEWLERRHQGHLGSYYFEGRLRIEDTKGQEAIFEYTVELELNAAKKWQVMSMSMERR